MLLLLLSSVPELQKKEYRKEFYSTGTPKAEGWELNGFREDYWIFYHPNGKVFKKGHYLDNRMHGYWYFYSEENELIKEGHIKQGVAEDWWIFYEGKTVKKVQMIKGNKEGFALCYSNRKLERVEKYFNNEKTGEWTSLNSFKIDNPEVKF